MNSCYDVVPYTDEHLEPLVDLQAHLWGHDRERRRAYLHWKYRANPFMDLPLILVALHDGEPVGMRGFWGACWQVGARTRVEIPCAGDIVLAPAHRNRGLFARLNRCALEALTRRGYPYAFCASSGILTHLGLQAAGWRSIGCLRRVARGPRLELDEEPFARFDGARGEAVESGLRITATARVRASEMAALLEHSPGDDRIQPLRSTAYFEWRFRNPFSEYRFVYCDAPERLEGYLVLQCDLGRGWDVRVLDWEASSDAVRWALLAFAQDRGCFDSLSLWAAGLPDEVERSLRDAGFTPWFESGFLGRSRPTMLVQSTAMRHEAEWDLAGVPLLELSSWKLSMLCSDAY